jgi:hypothetical protein
VYQDIIIGDDLARVIRDLEHQPVYVVVLCPDPAVVAKRDSERSKTAYTTISVEEFDHVLRHATPRLGLWLDTSSQTADETVETILASLEQAIVGEQPFK